MKRIYIAGPMRGYTNYNFDAFDTAAGALHGIGWIPISPADMDRLYEGWEKYPPTDLEITQADKARYMRRDLAAIETCSAIYMLKGWEDSGGARLELAWADYLGLEVIYG